MEAGTCYWRPRVSKLLKEDCQAQVHSDQMVLMMARHKAGPVSQWPLKGCILSSSCHGGLPDSSQLRLDGARDSQMGGWINCLVDKEAQINVGKQL